MVSEVESLGPWAHDPRVLTAVSGADPDRAEAEARRLVARECTLLVSWGLAGGLAPELATGVVIEPDVVILPDGTRVGAGLAGATGMSLLGSDRVVASPAEKAVLHASSGAVAVDMESHRLAGVARRSEIGLRVVRAISDPADRSLPSLAATALGPDGRPRIGRVLRGLLRRPHELPSLIAAGRDSQRALKALGASADRVFAGLFAPR